MRLSPYWVTVHVLMAFQADIWRLTASACDNDQCFMVNCFVAGCFAKVTSAEAAKQDAVVILSKLNTGCQCGFVLAVLALCFLTGDSGLDYLSVQLTPNRVT